MNAKEKTELVNGLLHFTEACVKACAKQSEKAVEMVDKTLQYLIQDANRISKMSEETLEVLNQTRQALQSDSAKMSASTAYQAVLSVLQKLNSQHTEIDNFIMPIITTLQFQDRARQQMENASSMVRIWLVTRASQGSRPFSPDDRLAFAKKLVAITTMSEEREVLRRWFPELPPEAEQEAADIL